MSGTTTTSIPTHAHTYPPLPAPVTFPPQPPHSNVLSPEERARLLRSNKKLARLLGSTPHFMDQDSVESPWPTTDATTPFGNGTPLSRPSTSSGAPLMRVPTKSSLSRITSRPSSRPSTAQGTYASESPSREDAWRARKATLKPSSISRNGGGGAPPVLKLAYSAAEGLPLTAVAADAPRPALPSPSSFAIPDMNSRYRGGRGEGEGQELDLQPIRRSRSTARPGSAGSAHERTPSSPGFEIPTEASVRRTKLDKLRRTLGEELPAKAVFPSNSSSKSSSAAAAASTIEYTRKPTHKSSKSLSHPHPSSQSQSQSQPRATKHTARPSDPSVSVIALPGAHGEQTHTVVLKASTTSRAHTSASASSSHHRQPKRPSGLGIADPRDLLSLAGVEPADSDSAGLLGARKKTSASATLGGDAFVKSRRAKAGGRPEIEFVGFMGRAGV
ncbi:hypothetical protein CONPUDRAFT_139987 [Coniophora puteana RWD-64-598 SS2]|uniref:Uncharacterized protein n=1 Tax=Coniophora puteana (strain RWD-64-598) TaxID=741705 RepID=A0A5M3M8U2_CONPW|nr:uncharacterized protein CONPUDRAFT_139987 [Coniophora puteana RWD-64-598 SS2]EIW75497.1 hypothetical protein CONPUDRAFT_139987 [Coniophora puteana RWD-64-598 SS2]